MISPPTECAVSAIYLHIPFCHRVCPFCSFAVLKDRPDKHRPYLAFLDNEVKLWRRSSQLDFSPLSSVYLGGGTPSCLTEEELSRLVAWLRCAVPESGKARWTLELNPEDVSGSYMATVKRLGFDRVSLGVQSFSASGLKTLGRLHRPDEATAAFDIIQQSGLDDWNLDLLYGYPGQSLTDLRRDLYRLMTASPSHISVYCLNIEEKTAVNRKIEWKRWQGENEGLLADMMRLTIDLLSEHGYDQYEISNFARKGRRSLSNILTWQGYPYLGLGLGAHSQLADRRWGNHRRWKSYRHDLESGRFPQAFGERLSANERLQEVLLLGLRQTEGIRLADLASRFELVFASGWDDKIQWMTEQGLIRLEEDRLRLSVEGMLLADEVTIELSALLTTPVDPERSWG